jgi:ATP-dependent Clp protease protease subunit
MEYVVNVFGEIGYEVQLADILNPIAKATKSDTIIVNINSFGGEVFTGFSIYDALVSSPAKVVTKNIGCAMSIAATILMAGDEIQAYENSTTMVHNSWTFVAGNADELKLRAAELEQIDKRILNIFSSRRGIDTNSDEFQSAYKTEKELTSNEAKALGLIDTVIETNKPKEAAKKAYAYFDITKKNQSFMSKPNSWREGFEALKAKVNKAFAQAEAIQAATATVRLEDGTELVYTSPEGSDSTDVEINGRVTYPDGTPAPAGRHTLENGTVIDLDENGVVLIVEMPNIEDSADVEALKAENAELKAMLEKSLEQVQALSTEVGKFKALQASGKPKASQTTVGVGKTEKVENPTIAFLNSVAAKANKS